jgi:hemerythrin-like domain-containing protein
VRAEKKQHGIQSPGALEIHGRATQGHDEHFENLQAGEKVNADDLEKMVEFIRVFADKCHHSKEEKLLFERMQARGVSGEVGPIAVMLREHQDGRAHVKNIAELSGQRLSETTMPRHGIG